MGTRAVQKCMELFLAYPFNNALHRHVATLLLAFDTGGEAVVDFLLGECGLLAWLANAPEQVRGGAGGQAGEKGEEEGSGGTGFGGVACEAVHSAAAGPGRCPLHAPLLGSQGMSWRAAVPRRSTRRRGRATRVRGSASRGAQGTLATSRCWPTSCSRRRRRGQRWGLRAGLLPAAWQRR